MAPSAIFLEGMKSEGQCLDFLLIDLLFHVT